MRDPLLCVLEQGIVQVLMCFDNQRRKPPVSEERKCWSFRGHFFRQVQHGHWRW